MAHRGVFFAYERSACVSLSLSHVLVQFSPSLRMAIAYAFHCRAYSVVNFATTERTQRLVYRRETCACRVSCVCLQQVEASSADEEALDFDVVLAFQTVFSRLHVPIPL